MNANLHKPHKIECDFEGHPPIIVTWKKDTGVQITDIDRIQQKDNLLLFKTVEKEDEGRYWCTGRNSFSKYRTYVNISVYGKSKLAK